ncbi:hypothetical protein ACI2K4_29050 [Micromonospora sp. NPDC050397]|uniref:hypothetical protein n=1 Tax=Micromonospora sp. NPDC050397 TaxID=3364279 RepID=UPI00384DF4E3
MGRKIDRRTVIVDGREMVAIAPADFERLDASRRQVGARVARVVRLRQELHDAHARITRVRAILTDAQPAECVCDRLAAVLGDESAQDSSLTHPIRSRRRS